MSQARRGMRARKRRALSAPGEGFKEGTKKTDVRSEVLTNADAGTGDTVCDRGNPGELRLVNGEMGGGWAKETLLVQDSLRGGRREGLSLNGSVFRKHGFSASKVF